MFCIFPSPLRTTNIKLQVCFAARHCRMVMGPGHLTYKAERAGLFIPMKNSVRNLIAVYKYLTGWCGEGIAKVSSELHS